MKGGQFSYLLGKCKLKPQEEEGEGGGGGGSGGGRGEEKKKNCSQVPDTVTRMAKINKFNNILC